MEAFSPKFATCRAGVRVDGMGIHPAVLDAVLHAAGVAVDPPDRCCRSAGVACPLHAAGAGKAAGPIHGARCGRAMSVDVADTTRGCRC